MEKLFFKQAMSEYYAPSFCWRIPSSCENHCNLIRMLVKKEQFYGEVWGHLTCVWGMKRLLLPARENPREAACTTFRCLGAERRAWELEKWQGVEGERCGPPARAYSESEEWTTR
jgi:hypothetical protein